MCGAVVSEVNPLRRVLIKRDCPAIADCRKRRERIAPEAQAIFCRRRHQPRRPPQTAISPGRPAPTTGPGTARSPRISPVGKFMVWMFRYVSPARRAATNTGSAVAALPPKNEFPTLPGGTPTRLYVELA